MSPLTQKADIDARPQNIWIVPTMFLLSASDSLSYRRQFAPTLAAIMFDPRIASMWNCSPPTTFEAADFFRNGGQHTHFPTRRLGLDIPEVSTNEIQRAASENAKTI